VNLFVKVLLTVTAISAVSASTLRTASADEEPQPLYRIGVSLPLTGDLAEYGTAVRNGMRIAEDKFPPGRKRIELIYDDNKYDAKTALSVVQKFSVQKLDLLYSWGEVPFNAIAPVVEKKGIPLLAFSLDNTAGRKSRCITLAGW
jgi:ABC-type branched-subunit amino acid transport system substrate-binding protein